MAFVVPIVPDHRNRHDRRERNRDASVGQRGPVVAAVRPAVSEDQAYDLLTVNPCKQTPDSAQTACSSRGRPLSSGLEWRASRRPPVRTHGIAPLFLLMIFVASSNPARAQTATSGTIAGAVRDISGAVLPGV